MHVENVSERMIDIMPQTYNCCIRALSPKLSLCNVQVLVLPRVVRHVPAYIRERVGDLTTQTTTNTSSSSNSGSNVYGVPERVILAWLNYHYTQQRANVLGRDSE